MRSARRADTPRRSTSERPRESGISVPLRVIIGLATAIGRDAALKTAISENLLERPRRSLRQVLERAVARGEIAAGRDLDLLSDVLIGLNTMRILFGEVPDPAYVRRVFETILYPLAIAPES